MNIRKNALLPDDYQPITDSIESYIEDNYPSKASFARSQGITPQQLTKWVNKGFIVSDGVIYSPRRTLCKVIV